MKNLKLLFLLIFLVSCASKPKVFSKNVGREVSSLSTSDPALKLCIDKIDSIIQIMSNSDRTGSFVPLNRIENFEEVHSFVINFTLWKNEQNSQGAYEVAFLPFSETNCQILKVERVN